MSPFVNCSACSQQISSAAPACPRCGHPNPYGVQYGHPAVPQKKQGSLLLALFIVGLPIAGIWFYAQAQANTGITPASLLRQPVTLVSQTIVLHEGNAMGYGFTIPDTRTIQVTLSATPKPVNILLMREEQWQRYQQVHGSLFGGRFEYVNRLSSQNVTRFNDSAALPGGSWRIVVERPSEAVLFGDDTSASITVVAN